MKTKSWAVSIAVLAGITLGAVSLVSAQDAAKPEAPKAEKGIVVGEVISIANYAMEGAVGPETAEASKFQVDQGFPVGIIEQETGEVWVAIFRDAAPASPLETANKALSSLVGKVATVQGLKYRAKGVNVIRVSLASEY